MSNISSIFIGNNILSEFEQFLQSHYKNAAKFILVDENTLKFCLPELMDRVPSLKEASIIKIKSGEENKNITTCVHIWNELSKKEADRNSLLINLGGGIIGDIGGFTASTYKRGIDFINIPTTLLAQADASVGGKVGVDLNMLKNQIGTFNHPKAVFINPSFLKTLSKRQLLTGFAEMLKHGLIADKNYWDKIKTVDINDIDNLETLIIRSIQIKNEIVNKDHKEKNIRKTLNFGHTIGHAIETYSHKNDKTPLLHGEAVAIGMICEAYISHQIAGLTKPELEEITSYIVAKYPPYQIEEKQYLHLIRWMKNDKKNIDGNINFTLLENIGNPLINKICRDEIIIKSLTFYLNSVSDFLIQK